MNKFPDDDNASVMRFSTAVAAVQGGKNWWMGWGIWQEDEPSADPIHEASTEPTSSLV